MQLMVDELVKKGYTGNDVLVLANRILSKAKKERWLELPFPEVKKTVDELVKKSIKDRTISGIMSLMFMETIMGKRSSKYWEQFANAVDAKLNIPVLSSEKVAKELFEISKILVAVQEFQPGDYIMQPHDESPIYGRVIEQQKNGGYKAVLIGGWSGNKPATKSTKNAHPDFKLVKKTDVPPKFLQGIAKKFPSNI